MTDCYIARSSAAARALGGSAVIMSADSSLITLNEVATAIWNAADGVTLLSEIVERAVCGQFEIDPSTARADAEDFINRLAQHGVLIVSNQPIHSAESSARS